MFVFRIENIILKEIKKLLFYDYIYLGKLVTFILGFED